MRASRSCDNPKMMIIVVIVVVLVSLQRKKMSSASAYMKRFLSCACVFILTNSHSSKVFFRRADRCIAIMRMRSDGVSIKVMQARRSIDSHEVGGVNAMISMKTSPPANTKERASSIVVYVFE